MDSLDSSKNFATIHEDYAFFLEHSTETEADLRGHVHNFLPLVKTSQTIRFLDFGCGDGLFTSHVLRGAGCEPNRLRLALVEPDAGYLHQALARLQIFTASPISGRPSLPSVWINSFDLILANHVLYYVTKLDDTLGQLLKALAAGGCLLIAMAGAGNILCQLDERSFASIKEPMPYYQAEDIESTLAARGQEFQKLRIDYEVNFADKEENRIKMLRFMLGKHLVRMDREKILKLFDAYAREGNIVIRTHHYQYIIHK